MDPLSTCLLFEQFLSQRRYLKNVTPSTIEWYQTAFKALQKALGADAPSLTKPSLQQFVVSIRQRGVKPVSCNTYIKALNAFCLWLHEEGHFAQRLQLPMLKVEQRIIQAKDLADVRKFFLRPALGLSQFAHTTAEALQNRVRSLRHSMMLCICGRSHHGR